MRKTIFITGATRGLGRALAERWRAEGHCVAGFGRTANRQDIESVDITSEDSVAAWCRSALDRFGAPDLLLNNAGVVNTPAPLWEVSEREFAQVLNVNIAGIARMVRHIVPAMIEAGHGVIVNLSSGWGRSTSPEVAPYCASKYAVEGLSSALAQELPLGLACIALNPGVIDTEMLRQCWGDGAASFTTPEKWAAQAGPYILSLKASDNGRSLTAPGG